MTDKEEFLEALRASIRAFPAVSQIIIDEYQLRLATSEVTFTSETAWELTTSDGELERLDADVRHRVTEGYAICRLIGRNIVSVDIDSSESLALAFDTGDRLVMPKRQEGWFESYNINGGQVGFWVA